MDEQVQDGMNLPHDDNLCPIQREWPGVKMQLEAAAKRIENIESGMLQMKTGVEEVVRYIQHLSQLDQIAKTLSNLADKLIAPATGKAFHKFYLLVVILLAAVIFALLYRDSAKNFHFGGPSGIHIEEPIDEGGKKL